MDIIGFIENITNTKDIIDNAIENVNQAIKSNNKPLQAAIEALLPQDYDRKAFFNSFDFDKDGDQLFNKFFESPKYFTKESIKHWQDRMIVLVAIAFIGLDYSGKKDEVGNIKKKLEERKRNFRNLTRIGIALDDLLDGANAEKIAVGYGFVEQSKMSSRSLRSQDRKVLEIISEKLSSLIKKSKLEEFLSDRMDGIFFITTVIVGLAVIARVVNNYKKSSEKKLSPEKPEHSEAVNASEPAKVAPEIKPDAIKKPIPAIMAVVIPANKLGSETKEGMDISDAIRFIDAAVYFACFQTDNAKKIEEELDLKDQILDQTLLDSAQDIYVSLKTEDGDDLIGASLKFSLKKSLRNKPRDFRITKIRLLDKLRGLDKFNRI